MLDNVDHIVQLIKSIDRLSVAVMELRSREQYLPRCVSAKTFGEMIDVSESAILKGWRKTGKNEKPQFPSPTHKFFEGEKGWRWSMECVQVFLQEKWMVAQEKIEGPDSVRPYVSIRRHRKTAA